MVRTRPVLIFVGAVFAFFLGACSVSAQVDQAFETGMNPYRSYQTGNIDTIGLWGKQLNVDIPIISYPQRGGKLQLNYVLHYANLGEWNDTSCSPSPCSYSSSGNNPMSGFGVIQAGAIVAGGGTCGTYPQNTQDELCNYTAYLADGGASSLLPTNSTTWKSPDLQGIQLSHFSENQYNPSALLTDRNGISYEGSLPPPGNLLPLFSYAFSATPPGLAQDANGNQISFQAYGSGLNPGIGWTDTMGRNIPLPVAMSPATVASTCPQTPVVPDTGYVWNFPGVSGGTYAVTFCYAEIAYHIVNVPGYLTSGNLDELQSVLLPNGTKWTFQYSTDGNVDLNKITFPTGGSLSYAWGPTNNYVDGCAVHSYANTRPVVTRTLSANSSDSPSGTWTYGGASGGRVIVTDPLSNDTVHTFTDLRTNSCPFYETKTQYYQGSYTSGTLLKTVNTAFTPLQPNSNFGQPATINTVWPNSQENQVSIGYDSAVIFQAPIFVISNGGLGGYTNTTPQSYGLVLSKKEYDYGTSPNPGSLLRTTTTTYEALTNSNYLANNLLTLPASVVITGAGPGSTATYAYDGSALQPSNISTQHISPPTGTYRGNPTTSSQYLNTTGAYLNTSSTFYDTGMPYVVTDANGNQTTYGYSSTYAGALPTSVENAKRQTTTFAYDFNTGLQTSTTDPNGLVTSTSYDDMWRPATKSTPSGGLETITHQESSAPFSATMTRKITSTQNYVETSVFDGLGRISQDKITDPQGMIYTDTTYDGKERTSTVSNPYRSTSDTTYGITTNQYDALDRTILVIPPDGTSTTNNVSTKYCGGSTLSTDQAGHWRRTKTDGLGRLIEADEPNSLTATVNVCPGTGEPIWATTYSYDALDDLTTIVQGGTRTRTFACDSLKRITSATNPETGTVLYTYDSNGNVVTRTDAVGRIDTYTYDVLNRILSETPTPTDSSGKRYQYDSADCFGVPRCAEIGQLVATFDFHGDEVLSYDPLDRQISVERNILGKLKSSTYTLNYDGSLASLLYPSGSTIQYTTDSAGRPSGVTDTTNNIVYISGPCNNGVGFGTCYAPQGAVTTWSYGPTTNPNYVNHEVTFNNRLQLGVTTIFAEGSTSALMRLTYSYVDSNGHNNGNVVGISNYYDSTRSQQFTYDQVNRVATAETASTYATSPAHCWGEAYVYDNLTSGEFGNLTNINVASSAYNGCSQEGLSLVSNTKNQMTALTYDAAGNVLNDGTHAYTWNADGHMASAAGVGYMYDVHGNRFEKGGQKWYWFGLGSQALDESDTSGNVTDEYIYFANRRVAHRILSSNTVYFYGQDTVGSSRVLFNAAGTLCYDGDFYPFGGERAYTNTCTQNYKYVGNERDPESLQDNFNARYFASRFGRFNSPDPSGLAYADQTNPQSLNLYTYAINNPLRFKDPSGLYCVDANGDEMTDDGGQPLYLNEASCSDGGGGWVTVDGQPGQQDSVTVNGDGGCPTSNPECQNLLGQALSTLGKMVCSAIPSGRTVGTSGALGAVGSVVGGAEVVINYNSGQVSAFGYGGTQVGWNGVASASIYTGFVYGLNDSNSNYSGGFTGGNVGAVVGGYASSSSGGMTGGPAGVVPTGQVTAVGVSIGASWIGAVSGGANVTNYSKPIQLGKFGAYAIPDYALYVARQLCK